MALVETTLSSACGASDRSVVVASATSIAAGRLIEIDGEVMQVTKDYSSGTTVNVLRGRDGTVQKAHVATARVTHGDPTDFGDPAPGGPPTNYPAAGGGIERRSYSATATIDAPKPGSDMLVVINGTSVVALTVAVPTKAMDGCRLTIVANGAAAHTVTFTGGLSGAGSSYDVVTFNGTAPAALEVIACNELWVPICQPAMGGTVTNLIGSVA
jgi:hypothetical protein